MPTLSKQKVVFVVPPSSLVTKINPSEALGAPLEGTTVVATVLQQNGYKINCYDLQAARTLHGSFSPMLAEMLDEVTRADAVCIAGSGDTYPHVLKLASDIKKANSRIPIILGGILATFSWKTILTMTSVDYCVMGEGENTLCSLLSRLHTGAPTVDLPVAWKLTDGKPVFGKAHEHVKQVDLNKSPCPNYKIWENSFEGKLPGIVTYSTQRGCKASCSFCANPWKRKWRLVSLDKVRRDLTQLKAIGFKEVFLNDPTFNTDQQHCRNVAEVMDAIDLPWGCCIRAKPMSYELLHQMHESGCKTIWLGIESADQTVLDMHNKGTRVDDIERCLKTADKVGIPILGYLLLGLPGESEESLEKTKNFALNNSFIPIVSIATPYPGTRLFQEYLKSKRANFCSDEAVEADLLTKLPQFNDRGATVPIEIPGRFTSLEILKQTVGFLMQLHIRRVRKWATTI